MGCPCSIRANGCRTRLIIAYRLSRAHTKTKTARAVYICERFARLIQFERGKLELAEHRAADAAIAEQTQKRRCGLVYLNSHAVLVVAKFSPATRHADAVRRGNEKRNRRAVIDAVCVKPEG